MTTFCWPPPKAGGAGALETTDGDVDVSGSAPPTAGQVLTAVSDSEAQWLAPGLRYDPSIKFWTSSTGEATIGPNTWGFVEQSAPAVPITVSIVSDLTQPPVSSKFGLYVGAAVTSTVTVALIGTSQIMAPDGTLGTTCTIYPNAYYEWILYHEAGVALWGLVGITAGVARSIAITGAAPLALPNTAPSAGHVLKATSPTALTWAAGQPTNIFIDPPSAPDAWNDEFDSGSAVLATRGWTLAAAVTPGTPLTRVGEVDNTINPQVSLTAGQYRSSLRDGKLLLQLGPSPAVQHFVLYKASVGAFAYAARMGASRLNQTDSHVALIAFNNNTGGMPSGTNYMMYTGAISNNPGQNTAVVGYHNGAYQTPINVDVPVPSTMRSFFMDWTNTSNVLRSVHVDADTNFVSLSDRSRTLAGGPFSMNYAGLWLRCANVAGDNYICIDYLRRYPSGSFFPTANELESSE